MIGEKITTQVFVRFVFAGISLFACGETHADMLDFTIDAMQSSTHVTIDAVGAETASSDVSPLSGQLVIELDSVEQPGSVSLHDLQAGLVNSLSFELVYPELGSLMLMLHDATVSLDEANAPVGPVPIEESQLLFDGTDAPVFSFTGELDVMPTGSLVFLVGSQQVDMSSFAPLPADVSATLTRQEDIFTFDADATIMLMHELTTNVELMIVLTLSVHATAELSPSTTCLCDANTDGTVDFLDLLDYLDLWFQGSAVADVNGDGEVNFLDLLDFLDCWFESAGGDLCEATSA